MNKKGFAPIALIMGLVIILAVIGGIYYVSKKPALIQQNGQVAQNNYQVATSTQQSNLELNIITPKDTYKVSEKFTGAKYWLKYEGEPFEGIVAYDEYKKGSEDRILHGRAVGEIKTGDFDSNLAILRQALLPFNLNSTGNKDYFTETGEYVYTISVYKCEDVGLKENCSTKAATPELLSNFKPLKSVSKTIVVTNQAKPNTIISTSSSKTVLDCGQDGTCTMNYLNAFEANLKSCKPSTGTTPIGWEPTMGIYRSYEIVGLEGDLCVIKFSFLKTDKILSTWLGKEMVCKYTASERNITAVASSKNCSGPLLDEINRTFKQQ